MSRTETRRASVSDAPAIGAFRRAMFAEMGVGDAASLDAMEAAFIRYAEQAVPAGEYVGWMAEADGVAVAHAGLIVQQLPPHPRNLRGQVGYVLNVYVDPAWRRRGLATRLVGAAVVHCRELGLGSVALHASDAGAPVYRRLGFERTTEMRLFL